MCFLGSNQHMSRGRINLRRIVITDKNINICQINYNECRSVRQPTQISVWKKVLLVIDHPAGHQAIWVFEKTIKKLWVQETNEPHQQR